MKQFHITRLQTSIGTLRLTGELGNPQLRDSINYHKVEMMGTDGWLELDLSSNSVKNALTQIQHMVLDHLL
ncbi:hypothetical protein [Pseudoalteromonas luteoviolacea]|uniref:Uncharacterized protein n=1 Tax=Pseudoalteromonas luteoviolacea NCIMB 1942 TaxID=1365253 RepID=A0A167AVI5_9GAMM|nr:hypothetical protein [Pseudoalteromonas luteoviolacea]KZN45850.1 hypothetical protein N482_13585 [Pseudoalteromonas luteoviolacea NCIMB 1942]KZW98628.1 hypothetical protein JL49_22075 [Pseudoalteromonas luteoviolacea]